MSFTEPEPEMAKRLAEPRTMSYLKKDTQKRLEYPSQSHDLIISNLWVDLKQATCARQN